MSIFERRSRHRSLELESSPKSVRTSLSIFQFSPHLWPVVSCRVFLGVLSMSCLSRLSPTCLLQAAVLISLAGCGGGEDFSLGKVTGTVTCEGKPVSEGTVTFTPIASGSDPLVGKPAMGAIGSDGSFELMTYVQGDGAVIGKHRVSVTFPGEELGELSSGDDAATSGDATAKPRKQSKSRLPPCAGSSAVIEKEVVAGENNFDVELSPDSN